MSIELYVDQFRDRRASLLCSVFQAAAYDTWERIAFSRMTPGLRIHETTITQNLVYELNLLKWRLHLTNLFLYESRNEATNGHDLDLLVRQRDGHYRFMIQSKILYHNIRKKKKITLEDGKYPQLSHRVGGHAQVDLLIRQAQRQKAIPLYLLYNFVTQPLPTRLPTRWICRLPAEAYQYGCSLVSPHYLKSNLTDPAGNLRKNVKFSDLHPSPALPWMILACCLPRYNLKQTLRLFQLPGTYEVENYDQETVAEQGFWRLLAQDPSSQQPGNTFREAVGGFSPRYRIVIDTATAGEAER